jgi:DNA repair protein RecO (recombination protein O)
VPTYRDEAIVLRTQKLGESDRIVTLLTRNHGRVRVVGRGVRKTSSRIGARLEPFSHIDVQCYQGRSLDSVSQVESIAAHGASLTGDYARWTAGTAMLETAERLTPEEHQPALSQYVLLVSGLRSLAGEEHPPGLILDSYLLRSLSVAGWSPTFSDCARCGDPGPHRAFSLAGGGMVCQSCRPSGSAAPAPATVELLSALLTGDWQTAEASEERARKEASGLIAAYLQWHVERQVRSLSYVDRTSVS